jgi:MSHA biogenesis protein MshI
MKLDLPAKIKQLFGKKTSDFRVGISLHANFVRLVKGKLDGGQWQYHAHEEVAIDSEEQWLSTIVELITSHKLDDACCCVCLPGNRYQLLQIDKPSIPEEELGAALAWTVKDLVNVPTEELVADYFHVPAKIPMQGDKLNVIVTSIKTVRPLVDTFIKHKIDLAGIVPEELVIRNIIGEVDTACLLLSQQKNEEIALQIVKKEQIYFARKLRGFNRIHEYSAQELVDGLTDSLSLEVQRSMDYFESQLKQAPIKEILLALPTEHQTLIAEQIAQHFPIEVKTMQVANPSAILAEPLPEQFFPALGGALEYLIPEERADGE